MNALLCFAILVNCFVQPLKTTDIKDIRLLYSRAPLVKEDARQLDKLMIVVDSNAAPVMYCYKGANEMIQAKYALNPIVKLAKFNKGKAWITTAVNRDTLDVEMRFIRFSIQSNLPAFLGYRDAIPADKKFLLANIRDCLDKELKEMIINYLSSSTALTPEELKHLSN